MLGSETGSQVYCWWLCIMDKFDMVYVVSVRKFVKYTSDYCLFDLLVCVPVSIVYLTRLSAYQWLLSIWFAYLYTSEYCLFDMPVCVLVSTVYLTWLCVYQWVLSIWHACLYTSEYCLFDLVVCIPVNTVYLTCLSVSILFVTSLCK